MYTHCIYCKSELGRNEVIEQFPIGRRLAFDAAQGRLWVVCKQCSRWNLTPMEERWEAIESCERLYRDTHTRLATENIGLARVAEGTDLVRIGKPQRPEFAAWRYGDQLVRRRRREITSGLISLGVGAAAVALGGAALGVSGFVGTQMLFTMPQQLIAAYQSKRRVASVTDSRGRTRVLNRLELRLARLLQAPDGWRLSIPQPDGAIELRGPSALRTAATILPHINYAGAKDDVVQAAVREIQYASTSEDYFNRVATHLQATERVMLGKKAGPLIIRAPAPMRVALEMISHEDQERRALEGELRDLEAMWREAEEIAAISDNLLLPRSVAEWLKQRKAER